MKSYLKGILLFDKEGSKRVVPLKDGINIITGESKTGKSALVEIIDYCLCSSRCTVPKGIITEFAEIYSIILYVNGHSYIIARQRWSVGGKMLFEEVSNDINVDLLEYNFFSKEFINYDIVRTKIESVLNLNVTNTTTEPNEKKKKASLRNMVSYLFQHQNLMASKFALFYRFSDFYKRKDAIEQFPVFAGIVNQEYYSDLITLNEYENKLKLLRKKQRENENSITYVKDKLISLLANYYSLIGEDFKEDITSDKAIKLATNLPSIEKISFNSKAIADRYHNLKKQIEDLRTKEREFSIQISNLEGVQKTGKDFSSVLIDLQERINISKPTQKDYVCPFCGAKCEDIKQQDEEIEKSAKWLENEIQITNGYNANFVEDIRLLETKKEETIIQIKALWKEYKELEEKYINSKNLKSKVEEINYAKAQIHLFLDMQKDGLFNSQDEEIKDLQTKIALIKEIIDAYNYKDEIAKAQVFISDNMNKLAQSLDFEEEYKPINLTFDIMEGTFDLYHKGKEKIRLYEMGSGANWVSCHIALFLSLLHYFAKQKNSPMPLIMFFDQPSQVYFPQGDETKELKQADIIAVNNMYKTMFTEIKNIEADTSILPQLIIVDHVSSENLAMPEFNDYVRCNWRNKSGLI